MDTADEKTPQANTVIVVDNIPMRPLSGDPNARRAVVNADNFVDLIVAGRKKNKSKFIPASDQPNTRRPRRIIMPDNDFKLVFGAAAGTLHDYAERPEIEIAVVRMVDLNAIPTAELTKPSLDELAADKSSQIASSSVFDLSMELSAPLDPNDTNFRLLYDDTRCAFVLTQNIEDHMLTILRERRLGMKLPLPSIIEMKEEERLNTTNTIIKTDLIPSSRNNKKVKNDDDSDEDDEDEDEQGSKQREVKQHEDLQIGMPETSLSIAAADNLHFDSHPDNDNASWQLSLETSFFLYGKSKDPKAYYTIDSRRQRLWRRFIRLYFDPILADHAHFAAMQDRLAKEVERKALAALNGLEVTYTPTDSEDESSVASASTVGSKRRGGGGHKHHKPSSSNAAGETAHRPHKKKKAVGSSNKATKKGEDSAAQEKKKEMPRTALMKRMASKKAR